MFERDTGGAQRDVFPTSAPHSIAAARESHPAALLALQRSVGNAAVARMLTDQAASRIERKVAEVPADPQQEEELAGELGDDVAEDDESAPASVPMVKVPEPEQPQGNERAGAVLQRQVGGQQRRASSGRSGGQASSRIGYFTVGDPNLNYGNAVFLPNLEDLPAALQRYRGAPGWTMVLSIHGAEDIVSGQGGHVSRRSGNVYDARRVQSILSSAALVAWRNAYGPSHLVMNACQLNASFEQVFGNSLVRPRPGGQGQRAQGLGTNCRPQTTTMTMEVGGREITTRAQYASLSRADQRGMLSDLQAENRQWGYFGRPPVPDNEVLRYYFDEPVRGAWMRVQVAVDHAGTGIPFYNRSQNTRFNQMCTRGIGMLPGRP